MTEYSVPANPNDLELRVAVDRLRQGKAIAPSPHMRWDLACEWVAAGTAPDLSVPHAAEMYERIRRADSGRMTPGGNVASSEVESSTDLGAPETTSDD